MRYLRIPSYLDDKGSLLYVSTDEGKLHHSWLLEDGTVVCYENIPENYPSGILCTWDSFDEYVDAIGEVWWLNEPDYIIRYGDELEAVGFPYEDTEFLDEETEETHYDI